MPASTADPDAARTSRRGWSGIPSTIAGVPRRRFIVLAVELVVLLVVVAALSYEPPAGPSAPVGAGAGLGVSAEELRTVFELDRNGGFVFMDERGSSGTQRLVGSSATGRLELIGDPANLQQIMLTVSSAESHLVELLALQVVPELAADVESVIEEAPEGRPEELEGDDALVTVTLNPEPNDDIEMLIEALGA